MTIPEGTPINLENITPLSKEGTEKILDWKTDKLIEGIEEKIGYLDRANSWEQNGKLNNMRSDISSLLSRVVEIWETIKAESLKYADNGKRSHLLKFQTWLNAKLSHIKELSVSAEKDILIIKWSERNKTISISDNKGNTSYLYVREKHINDYTNLLKIKDIVFDIEEQYTLTNELISLSKESAEDRNKRIQSSPLVMNIFWRETPLPTFRLTEEDVIKWAEGSDNSLFFKETFNIWNALNETPTGNIEYVTRAVDDVERELKEYRSDFDDDDKLDFGEVKWKKTGISTLPSNDSSQGVWIVTIYKNGRPHKTLEIKASNASSTIKAIKEGKYLWSKNTKDIKKEAWKINKNNNNNTDIESSEDRFESWVRTNGEIIWNMIAIIQTWPLNESNLRDLNNDIRNSLEKICKEDSVLQNIINLSEWGNWALNIDDLSWVRTNVEIEILWQNIVFADSIEAISALAILSYSLRERLDWENLGALELVEKLSVYGIIGGAILKIGSFIPAYIMYKSDTKNKPSKLALTASLGSWVTWPLIKKGWKLIYRGATSETAKKAWSATLNATGAVLEGSSERIEDNQEKRSIWEKMEPLLERAKEAEYSDFAEISKGVNEWINELRELGHTRANILIAPAKKDPEEDAQNETENTSTAENKKSSIIDSITPSIIPSMEELEEKAKELNNIVKLVEDFNSIKEQTDEENIKRKKEITDAIWESKEYSRLANDMKKDAFAIENELEEGEELDRRFKEYLEQENAKKLAIEKGVLESLLEKGAKTKEQKRAIINSINSLLEQIKWKQFNLEYLDDIKTLLSKAIKEIDHGEKGYLNKKFNGLFANKIDKLLPNRLFNKIERTKEGVTELELFVGKIKYIESILKWMESREILYKEGADEIRELLEDINTNEKFKYDTSYIEENMSDIEEDIKRYPEYIRNREALKSYADKQELDKVANLSKKMFHILIRAEEWSIALERIKVDYKAIFDAANEINLEWNSTKIPLPISTEIAGNKKFVLKNLKKLGEFIKKIDDAINLSENIGALENGDEKNKKKRELNKLLGEIKGDNIYNIDNDRLIERLKEVQGGTSFENTEDSVEEEKVREKPADDNNNSWDDSTNTEANKNKTGHTEPNSTYEWESDNSWSLSEKTPSQFPEETAHDLEIKNTGTPEYIGGDDWMEQKDFDAEESKADDKAEAKTTPEAEASKEGDISRLEEAQQEANTLIQWWRNVLNQIEVTQDNIERFKRAKEDFSNILDVEVTIKNEKTTIRKIIIAIENLISERLKEQRDIKIIMDDEKERQAIEGNNTGTDIPQIEQADLGDAISEEYHTGTKFRKLQEEFIKKIEWFEQIIEWSNKTSFSTDIGREFSKPLSDKEIRGVIDVYKDILSDLLKYLNTSVESWLITIEEYDIIWKEIRSVFDEETINIRTDSYFQLWENFNIKDVINFAEYESNRGILESNALKFDEWNVLLQEAKDKTEEGSTERKIINFLLEYEGRDLRKAKNQIKNAIIWLIEPENRLSSEYINLYREINALLHGIEHSARHKDTNRFIEKLGKLTSIMSKEWLEGLEKSYIQSANPEINPFGIEILDINSSRGYDIMRRYAIEKWEDAGFTEEDIRVLKETKKYTLLEREYDTKDAVDKIEGRCVLINWEIVTKDEVSKEEFKLIEDIGKHINQINEHPKSENTLKLSDKVDTALKKYLQYGDKPLIRKIISGLQNLRGR